jgi:hypothetical protein
LNGFGYIVLHDQDWRVLMEKSTCQSGYNVAFVFLQAFVAPFSICADRKRETIVLTVRGTLSIDDILTDLAISMVEVEACYHNPNVRGREFVHKVRREDGGKEGEREDREERVTVWKGGREGGGWERGGSRERGGRVGGRVGGERGRERGDRECGWEGWGLGKIKQGSHQFSFPLRACTPQHH